MEPPASTFREVTAVIVNLDTMETTVRMVRIPYSGWYFFCYSDFFHKTFLWQISRQYENSRRILLKLRKDYAQILTLEVSKYTKIWVSFRFCSIFSILVAVIHMKSNYLD